MDRFREKKVELRTAY